MKIIKKFSNLFQKIKSRSPNINAKSISLKKVILLGDDKQIINQFPYTKIEIWETESPHHNLTIAYNKNCFKIILFDSLKLLEHIEVNAVSIEIFKIIFKKQFKKEEEFVDKNGKFICIEGEDLELILKTKDCELKYIFDHSYRLIFYYPMPISVILKDNNLI
jgi:hypothetical protein